MRGVGFTGMEVLSFSGLCGSHDVQAHKTLSFPPCTNRQEAHTDTVAEPSMSDPVEALILDLLKWIGPQPRPYAEVIEAWRTSCPRLPVWEEANARGFITREHQEGVGAFVSVSPVGQAFLAKHRLRQSA